METDKNVSRVDSVNINKRIWVRGTEFFDILRKYYPEIPTDLKALQLYGSHDGVTIVWNTWENKETKDQ